MEIKNRRREKIYRSHPSSDHVCLLVIGKGLTYPEGMSSLPRHCHHSDHNIHHIFYQEGMGELDCLFSCRWKIVHMTKSKATHLKVPGYILKGN